MDPHVTPKVNNQYDTPHADDEIGAPGPNWSPR